MKKYFLLLMFMLLAWPGAPVHAQDKLVFSALEGSPLGIMVGEVLKEAYKRVGIEAELAFMPGSRALQMADDGKVDGAELRVETIRNRYKNLIMIPVPVYKTEIMVFSKNADIQVDGWESLKPYKIAAPAGYTAILDHLENHSVWRVSYEQIFRMLDAGRVEIGVVDRFNGLMTLGKLGLTGIKPISPPLKTIAFYNFLHKKHAALVPRITAVMQEMEKAGEIQAIWRRHERALLTPLPSKGAVDDAKGPR